MSPRLSTKHLQVLAAFRRSGNLSKIAEALKLTPSAVSRRIDEAEARLGCSLFGKSSNRVRLTPAGEYLLPEAERILADLERAEAVAARLSSDVRHVVRLGMCKYRAFDWLPAFAAGLPGILPGVRLELMADAEHGGLEALAGGTVDVVLTPFMESHPGTTRVALFEDELVALVAPSHRLARRRVLDPAEIEPEDFYTYDLAVAPGFEYLEFLRPANARPRRYVIVDTPEAAAGAARGGQGLTMLSRWAFASDIAARRLVALRLGPAGVGITWAAALRAAEGKQSIVHRLALQLGAFLRRPRSRGKPRGGDPH